MDKNDSSKKIVLAAGSVFVLMLIFFVKTMSLNTWSFLGAEMPEKPLKIGTNNWLGYQPLYLARNLKYFDDSPIRLIEYASATQVIRAFRNNAIDVACLTLDEALLLLDSGLDLQVFLVVDISNGGDVILAKPEIKSLSEIKGHNVGVENTALGAFFISRALETVGLKTSDINIIRSEIDEHESMLLNDDFDAVVTYEPIRTRLLAKGLHDVFDSSKIPGEIVDVLVASKKTIELYPEKIKTLLDAWFRVLNHIKTQPDSAATDMALRLNIGTKDILSAFKGVQWPDLEKNLELMDLPEERLLKTATKLARMMNEQKLLHKKIRIEDFFDLSAIKNIKNSTSKTYLK